MGKEIAMSIKFRHYNDLDDYKRIDAFFIEHINRKPQTETGSNLPGLLVSFIGLQKQAAGSMMRAQDHVEDGGANP